MRKINGGAVAFTTAGQKLGYLAPKGLKIERFRGGISKVTTAVAGDLYDEVNIFGKMVETVKAERKSLKNAKKVVKAVAIKGAKTTAPKGVTTPKRVKVQRVMLVEDIPAETSVLKLNLQKFASNKATLQNAFLEVLVSFKLEIEARTVVKNVLPEWAEIYARIQQNDTNLLNREGKIAQMNHLKFLAPASFLKAFEEKGYIFNRVTKETKRKSIIQTTKVADERTMHFDEDGNAIGIFDKINDSLVHFETRTGKDVLKLVKATVESIKANMSPVDFFLAKYKEALAKGVVIDKKGKSHKVYTPIAIFNLFAFSGKINGHAETVNYGDNLYHTSATLNEMTDCGFFIVKMESAEEKLEAEKLLEGRLVVSSVAQGYSGLVAPTVELADQLNEVFLACGAKYSMDGTIGLSAKRFNYHQIKVVFETVTDANPQGLLKTGKGKNNVVGNALHVITDKSLMPSLDSKKLHVFRQQLLVDQAVGVDTVVEIWTRLKLAEQKYAGGGITLQTLAGSNVDNFHVLSTNEIKFSRDEITLQANAKMSNSPELLAAAEEFAVDKEQGWLNIHGSIKPVTIYTFNVGEDEYNSSTYNVEALKNAKMYESFLGSLDKDTQAFVLAKYLNVEAMKNARDLAQQTDTFYKFAEELSKNGSKLLIKEVETNEVTGAISTENLHLAFDELDANGEEESEEVVFKSLFGEVNILVYQIAEMLAFIHDGVLIGKYTPRMFKPVLEKKLAEYMEKAPQYGYTASEVADRFNELKALVEERRFTDWDYDYIQVRKINTDPSTPLKMGGEIVDIGLAIDSFQAANALELSKRRIQLEIKLKEIAQIERHVQKLTAQKADVQTVNDFLIEIQKTEKELPDAERRLNEQWYKIRATVREQLKKGIYAFFKGHDTLYTTLQFRTVSLGLGEVLLPKRWENKYRIGDYVLVFRHPVTGTAYILRVIGYTMDNTIEVHHELAQAMGADGDGDNINVWALDDNPIWSTKIPREHKLAVNRSLYESIIKGTHPTGVPAEMMTRQEFAEDAWNNYMGKMMTYELTGITGHFLRRLYAVYSINDRALTAKEIEETAIIQQICVQGKNVGKRGLYENDPEVLLAVKASKSLSYELDIRNMVKEFFERYQGIEAKDTQNVLNFEEFFL